MHGTTIKMNNAYSFTYALLSSALMNILKMIIISGRDRMWRDTMTAS